MSTAATTAAVAVPTAVSPRRTHVLRAMYVANIVGAGVPAP